MDVQWAEVCIQVDGVTSGSVCASKSMQPQVGSYLASASPNKSQSNLFVCFALPSERERQGSAQSKLCTKRTGDAPSMPLLLAVPALYTSTYLQGDLALQIYPSIHPGCSEG